jgi:hypothetical protein
VRFTSAPGCEPIEGFTDDREDPVAAYTHYWTNRTCDHAFRTGQQGKEFDHTAGNQFTRRGVSQGDQVYAVTMQEGGLILIGRMTVGRIVHSDAEAEHLLGYKPWSADVHFIAPRGDRMPQDFKRKVPLGVVRQLRFETADGPAPLVFKSADKLDQQTLRGVRKLTPHSAALLDGILGPGSGRQRSER